VCPALTFDAGALRFLALLAQPSLHARVRILPASRSDPFIADDAAAAADHSSMAASIGVPTTAYGLGDILLLSSALRDTDLPLHAYDSNLARLRQFGGWDVGQVLGLLRRFHEIDLDGSGRLSVAELAASLGSSEAQVQGLFNFLDETESGSVRFSEFAAAVALMSRAVRSDRDRASVLFASFDRDLDGRVSASEMQSLTGFLSLLGIDPSGLPQHSDGLDFNTFVDFILQHPGFQNWSEVANVLGTPSSADP